MSDRATFLAAVQRILPRSLYGALRTCYHWLFKEVYLRLLGFAETLRPPKCESQALPSPRLRYKIQGVSSARAFVKGGLMCVENLQEALKRANIDLPSNARVLDFGCGCGRTLIPLAQRFPGLQLYGTDIDEEAIAWCKVRMAGHGFSVNAPKPPLSYRDAFFDLVYAISVFTHLDEDLQRAWLGELYRILRPGGHLLATVHGEAAWGSVPEQFKGALVERGFLFVRTDIMKGLLPDWYQTAYHSEKYILANWQSKFRLVSYQPRGMMNYHDIAILRKDNS